jgi:hypothetical protein
MRLTKCSSHSLSTALPLIGLFSTLAICGKNKAGDQVLPNACKEHSYETHLISEDPLVIYIDGFISQEEALYLVSLRGGCAQNQTNPGH